MAAKLANMGVGRPINKGTNLSNKEAAGSLNVSKMSVKSARKVSEHSEKIAKAVEQGDIPVSLAASIVADRGVALPPTVVEHYRLEYQTRV